MSNRSAKTVSLIQIEYPSASFGTQSLAPGQDFSYRFKVLGSGPVKLSYTDSLHKDHAVVGPTLKEGDEGTLSLAITEDGVTWKPLLRAK